MLKERKGEQQGQTEIPFSNMNEMDETTAVAAPPDDESGGPPALFHAGSPTDFLKGVVGKRVIVRLTSGVDYRGK